MRGIGVILRPQGQKKFMRDGQKQPKVKENFICTRFKAIPLRVHVSISRHFFQLTLTISFVRVIIKYYPPKKIRTDLKMLASVDVSINECIKYCGNTSRPNNCGSNSSNSKGNRNSCRYRGGHSIKS